jgi:hypothetical protein
MARFTDACAWIAYNDNECDGADAVVIETYLTTTLVADLFGKSTTEVAARVAKERSDTEARRESDMRALRRLARS